MSLETIHNPRRGGFVPSETPNHARSSSSLGAAPVCPNCYQWLQPDNHHLRLRPKPRPSLRVQRILRRKAHSKRLSLAQKNLLRRFQNASSALVRRRHPADTHSLSLYFNGHSACTVTLAPRGPHVCKYLSLKCLFHVSLPFCYLNDIFPTRQAQIEQLVGCSS